MGKAQGTRDKPQFVTEDGLVLDLKLVRSVIIDAFGVSWRKEHPEPQPPMETLSNGDPWPNVNDGWYQKQLREWNQEQERASTAFLFRVGIQSKPPADWQPMIELNGFEPTYIWLGEMLSDADLEQLVLAIVGVDNATPQAIEKAEKKAPPPGAENP